MTTIPSCHPGGRQFPRNPLILEMVRAFGIVLCPKCYRATRIATRRGWQER